jgi:hypothetical protein
LRLVLLAGFLSAVNLASAAQESRRDAGVTE